MHFKNLRSPFSFKIKHGGSVPGSPVNTVAPSILRLGNSIICNKGNWIGTDPITYSYVFVRSFDGVTYDVVQSSLSDTYDLSSEDNLSWIRCNVLGSNGISPNGSADSNILTIDGLLYTLDFQNKFNSGYKILTY